MSTTPWKRTFVVCTLAADVLVALCIAYAGLYTVGHGVHPVLLVELAAVCVLSGSFTRDPGVSVATRRLTLAGATVMLISVSAVEVNASAAALLGLGWLVVLLRRVRELTSVHDDEVQTSRLVWDLLFLAASWLPVLAHVQPASYESTRVWLLVFSLPAVLSRLIGMHAAQMQATELDLTPQSRRTMKVLVLLSAAVMAVLVLMLWFPRFRLVLLVTVGVGLLGLTLMLTWRSLVASLIGILGAFAFAYFLYWLLQGHKVAHSGRAPKPVGKTHLHTIPVHSGWLSHVNWGVVLLTIGLLATVWVIVRIRVGRSEMTTQAPGLRVERSRLPGRMRKTDSQPPTPLRQLVARWLRLQARDSNAITRGETLRNYTLTGLDTSPRGAGQATGTGEGAAQTLRLLVDTYEAERYGSRSTRRDAVEQLEAQLRAQGLWRRR